jgi:hypothetical protein
VVQAMFELDIGDRYAQFGHVGKVGQTACVGLMLLWEEDFLRRTTSVSHTLANGSGRERQWPRGFWEGIVPSRSMRRALRTLMPAFAAAISCE